MRRLVSVCIAGMLSLYSIGSGGAAIHAQQAQTTAPERRMTFFVTSRGMGNGANLGGLAGADKHCQMLAAAAGAGRGSHVRWSGQGARL